MENHELIALAREKIKPIKVNKRVKVSETIGVALSEKGNLYYAYSLRASCGLSRCAEEFLVAEMIKNEEYTISKLVVLDSLGNFLPPCGKCCELLTQISSKNKNIQVVLSETETIELNKIFCVDWKEIKDNRS